MVPYKTAYVLEEEIASENKQVVFFEQSDHLICLGNDGSILNKLVLEFLTKKEATASKLKEESVHEILLSIYYRLEIVTLGFRVVLTINKNKPKITIVPPSH